MGILDEAIKEHLELKRAHGAAEDELKQLEDEAFGAAERPGDGDSAQDAAAEAPTEFMAQPDLEQPSESGAQGESSRRRPDVADLQEAPPPPAPEAAPEPEAAQPETAAAPPDEPAEEESPAMEHEAVPEPEAAAPEPPEVEPEISSGPTTEEREAIAEQPTEMHDMEAELGDQPSEEEEYEEDDDFWDEKRLSDELDQALEAPSEPEPESEAEPEAEAEPEEALYEDAATEAEEPETAEPGSEQPERLAPSGDEDDVLEETPDFLEEAPEDDQLWFEQKPPKDFDFDD